MAYWTDSVEDRCKIELLTILDLTKFSQPPKIIGEFMMK
jgi:hypothetical protein